MRKIFVSLFCLVLLTSLVLAQDYKMEVSTSKNLFDAGEPITIKVTLLDLQNNPVSDQVTILVEDAEGRVAIEKQVLSNNFINVELNSVASYGQGTITATYKDHTSKGFFEIGISELASFEIVDDELIITNIGNTKYSKSVQITIGETTGTKSPKLNIGEKTSYKLVAPEGVYNIRVTDGKTTITEGQVSLKGTTGNVIGVLEDASSTRSPVTGGIRPDEDDDLGFLSYMGDNKFAYVFIFVIFGAMILLAVERRVGNKVPKK